MKKLLLFSLVLSATIHSASAQFEIGLKVSPSITSLRAESPTDRSFASDGGKFSFGGGLIVDYFFGENYAFSTGLVLAGKGGIITYKEDSGGIFSQSTTVPRKISTQYLQLPLSMKLFTNEIAPATRLYFQVGGSLNVPISTRVNDNKFYTDPATKEETKASNHVFFIDADALAGFGTEYQMAKSTKLFAGVSYHRGLLDIDRYFEKTRGFKDITIKNSSFNLDLGIKF